MSDKKYKIIILGASGYTGADSIRLLAMHPYFNIIALGAQKQAGKELGEIWPQFAHLHLPKLQKIEEIDFSGADAVISALPHGSFQQVVGTLPENIKIIDMSADFRLKDKNAYEQHYKTPHESPKLLDESVYGLCEQYREKIKKARIIACPGCYPTASLLALLPLIKEGLISSEDIVLDAKSGISGAGRSLQQKTLFCETAEGVSAYAIATHRHVPEMEQELSKIAGKPVEISFTPHLIPMSRGELVSAYVKMDKGKSAKDIISCWNNAYENESFIGVGSLGAPPVSTKEVRGSNRCELRAFDDRIKGRAVVISAIDNLVKGSAGQAVQNLNLLFGLEESCGLTQLALMP